METVKTNKEGPLSFSGELNRQCLQKKKADRRRNETDVKFLHPTSIYGTVVVVF